MIETIKVSSRGQIVIPEYIRNHLKIKEGTKLILQEKGKRIILEAEEDFLRRIKRLEIEKEEVGWLALAEENLKELWDNKEDEKEWQQYLKK